MLAYHNDPKLKQDILEQLCTTDYKIPMEEYETRFGIPEVLAELQRAIFEGLPTKAAKTWSIRFMETIPVGADLSYVWADFAVWLLVDPVNGVIQYTDPGTDAYEIILRVANLYRDGHTTQQMTDAASVVARAARVANVYFIAAANAANAAAAVDAANAADAARAAYFIAAAYANVNYAYAAANANAAAVVVFAADAVIEAHSIAGTGYAIDYSRDIFYIRMANKLLELLQNSDKTRTENASLP